MAGSISIAGARAKNLQDLSLDIPKGKLCAIAGPVGSGKSALIFSVIAAECEERIAKLFAFQNSVPLPLPPLRNRVDQISGLAPVRRLSNPEGPSKTQTLIDLLGLTDPLLRILGDVGTERCPQCGGPVSSIDIEGAERLLYKKLSGETVSINAVLFSPLSNSSTSEQLVERIQSYLAKGYSQVAINGSVYDLDQGTLKDFVETALAQAKAIELVLDRASLTEENLPRVRDSYRAARLLGASAVTYHPIDSPSRRESFRFERSCQECGTTPEELDHKWLEKLLQGKQPLESDRVIAALRLGSFELREMLTTPISELLPQLLNLSSQLKHPLWHPIADTFDLVSQFGLGSLIPSQTTESLSTEARSVLSLVSEARSQLFGSILLVDRFTKGLTTQEYRRLGSHLRKRCAEGLTVVCIENDLRFLSECEHLIVLGEGPGSTGGRVTYQGAPEKFLDESASDAASAREGTVDRAGVTLKDVRVSRHQWEFLEFASPGVNCLTGPLSSPREFLLKQVLAPCFKHSKTTEPVLLSSPCPEVSELVMRQGFLTVALQSSSQHSSAPHSTVATQMDILGPIRQLFAQLSLSKLRGYTALTFSHSSSKNSLRCMSCRGTGVREQRVPSDQRYSSSEEHCLDCKGRRYQSEVLQVVFRGNSISDLFEMSLSDADDLLSFLPGCTERFACLQDLGLGYLTLGQRVSELSSGEQLLLRFAATFAPEKEHTCYLIHDPISSLMQEEISRVLAKAQQKVAQEQATFVLVDNSSVVQRAADVVLAM